MNIVSHFIDSATRYPNKIAIVDKDVEISYAALLDEVKKTADMLSLRGITKGDKVLVFVPMSIDLYRLVLAIFYVGATAVFLDEWVSLKRLNLCCRLVPCKAMISKKGVKMLSFFSTELSKLPVKILHNEISSQSMPKFVNVDYSDTALVTFTTGSTGIPKAANRTHGFLQEQFSVLSKHVNSNSEVIDLTTMPIMLLLNLGHGATSLIANYNQRKPARFEPDFVVSQVEKYKPNRITASPFFYEALVKRLLENNISIPTIECIFTGGAPVFPRDAAYILKAFPGTELLILYGSTEAEPISCINGKTLINNSKVEALPVGKIASDIELKIIKYQSAPIILNGDSLASVSLKNFEVGEIVVAGKHVLTGYVNNNEAFAQNKIVDGDKIWHRTGDAGFVDEQGNLFLVGRAKTIFQINQTWVFPFIVEDKLKSINGITCGTILYHNNSVKVFIEADACIDELRVYEQKICEMGIVYDEINFVARIPRDPRHYSKIDYDKLLKLVAVKLG